MHTLIRTYTFIKYAERQLADVAALIEEQKPHDVPDRLADIASTVLKAFAAALPGEKRNLHELTEPELSRVISDLTFSPDEATEISSLIFTVSSASVLSPDTDNAKGSMHEAGEMFKDADRLVNMVSTLFPARPDLLN